MKIKCFSRKFFDINNVDEPLLFCQSPQTLLLDDGVRIFFSTRIKDNVFFKSIVKYIDFDFDLKLKSKPVTPLIPKPMLGGYDEHGTFPFHIYYDNLTNNVYGFISGWSRRESVSVETSIGISKSYDMGNSFNRIGEGPVLAATLNEPFLVCDPFVKRIDDMYYMWYIYGIKWIDTPNGSERVYKIGYATSSNLIDWTRSNLNQLIPDVIDLNECQALPTVFKKNNYYHMIFCYRNFNDFRENRINSYKLGYAYSFDLKKWHRSDYVLDIKSNSSWDNEMRCYPHTFEMNNKLFLIYNGNSFGKYNFGGGELIVPKIEFKINFKNKDLIVNYFNQLNYDFLSILNTQVNLNDYIDKILNQAQTLDLFLNNEHVGMAAFYINKKEAFITHFGIRKSYQGNGSSSLLLNYLIYYFELNNIKSIVLEVDPFNFKALKFYKNNHFYLNSENKFKITLLRSLNE